MAKSNIIRFIILDPRPTLKPQLLKSMLDNKLFTKLTFQKSKLLWLLGLSPMSGNDLKSNEGGKELAAAVDVT